MHVQAAAGRIRERLGHEARGHAVLPRDGLDRALQQHGVIAGELGARDVVQVDFELAGREFLERRAGGDVLRLAGRVEIGQERIDVLDVLHAAVLRADLRPARAGDAARLSATADRRPVPAGRTRVRSRATAVRPMSCSGCIAWRSTWRGSAKKGSPLAVAIASSTWAVGTCGPGHRGERSRARPSRSRRGRRRGRRCRCARRSAPLAVEQHGRAAEIDARRRMAWRTRRATTRLPRRMPSMSGCSSSSSCVSGCCSRNFCNSSGMRFCSSCSCSFPRGRAARALRHATAALAPSRLQDGVEFAATRGLGGLDLDVQFERLARSAARRPATSRLRLIACLVRRTACASFAAMRIAEREGLVLQAPRPAPRD